MKVDGIAGGCEAVRAIAPNRLFGRGTMNATIRLSPAGLPRTSTTARSRSDAGSGRLRFLQLNPIPANLDLAIGSASIINCPSVAIAPGRLCDTVGRTGCLENGSGTNLVSVRSGLPPIAARDSDATDIELSRHAHWNRLLIPIQYEDGRVGMGVRLANRRPIHRAPPDRSDPTR